MPSYTYTNPVVDRVFTHLQVGIDGVSVVVADGPEPEVGSTVVLAFGDVLTLPAEYSEDGHPDLEPVPEGKPAKALPAPVPVLDVPPADPAA